MSCKSPNPLHISYMNNERLAQFKDKLKEFTKLDDEVADAASGTADQR